MTQGMLFQVGVGDEWVRNRDGCGAYWHRRLGDERCVIVNRWNQDEWRWSVMYERAGATGWPLRVREWQFKGDEAGAWRLAHKLAAACQAKPRRALLAAEAMEARP